MNFQSCSEVLTDVTQLLIAGNDGAQNRAKINCLLNGDTPYTAEEARDENVKFNVNWLETTRIASNAVNQINNSVFKGSIYFKVQLETGPLNKRQIWGSVVTKYINQELKRCREYRAAKESAHAQIVAHGPGPLVWPDRNNPVPSDVGIEDVMIPAGTFCSMKNLDRFAIRREMTWGELYDATQGKNSDPGWNKDYVNALLYSLFKQGLVPVYQGNRWLFPEKLAEDLKEGMMTVASSSLAKLIAWDFFYRNDDNAKWNRKTVVDYSVIAVDDRFSESKSNAAKTQDFLYEKDDYAESWEEIVHWYIGNCSNVAPYRYHSIRSIGYMLYGPGLTSNKIVCRMADALMQSLTVLFKNVSDDNREKLQMIDLQNFGILPDGVSMVPANERHTADWQFVIAVKNQMKELMSESSSAFVPDVGSDTGPAMTATETVARQNSSFSLTSAVINQLSDQSEYEYREICRRFCIKNNSHPMAKRFRENIQAEGVPLEILDVEKWKVLPEFGVGAGNKSVELNITQALLNEMLPMASPDGQRIIMRRRYDALTDNPEESILAFPDAPAPPSNDVQYAQYMFPTLMLGMPVQVAAGVNLVTYSALLLTMTNQVLTQTQALLQSPDGLAIASERLAGASNVISHCEEQIQIIGQTKALIPKAKILFKQAAQMMGAIQQMSKAVMAQEQQKAQQNGQNPELQAEIQAKLIGAQSDAKIKEGKAQQQQAHKDLAWQAENQRRNATTQADINRKAALTHADIAATDLSTQADILRPQPQTSGAA